VIINFKPYSSPWQHQWDEIVRTADRLTWAHFFEQGLGKSMINLNEWRYNVEMTRKVDALLVAAPNGVHENWITDELAEHLPPDMDYEAMTWRQTEVSDDRYWKHIKEDLRAFVLQPRPIILAVPFHSFRDNRSWEFIKFFCAQRKVFAAVDESDDIGNPDAAQTRCVLRLTTQTVMRRINSGTPYKDGTPLAYYSQFHFLHPDILGFARYRDFKERYACWWQKPIPGKKYMATIPIKDPTTGRQKLQNLEELERKISIRSTRMTKAEAMPWLPPKLYDKVYFELSPQQQRVYDRLRDEHDLEFSEDRVVPIEMAMIVRLRLSQVASGFLPRDGDEEPERWIPGDRPRLETAIEHIMRYSGQMLVWSRWRLEIDELVAMLSSRTSVVRYDGGTSDAEKARAKLAFKAGDVKVLVGNAAAMSRGHSYEKVQRAMYVTNYDRLLLREQSEDRTHRGTTKNAVLYTDLIAHGTVDVTKVEALRAKKNVADYLMGRPSKEWI
jgi:hypothetical protein